MKPKICNYFYYFSPPPTTTKISTVFDRNGKRSASHRILLALLALRNKLIHMKKYTRLVVHVFSSCTFVYYMFTTTFSFGVHVFQNPQHLPSHPSFPQHRHSGFNIASLTRSTLSLSHKPVNIAARSPNRLI